MNVTNQPIAVPAQIDMHENLALVSEPTASTSVSGEKICQVNKKKKLNEDNVVITTNNDAKKYRSNNNQPQPMMNKQNQLYSIVGSVEFSGVHNNTGVRYSLLLTDGYPPMFMNGYLTNLANNHTGSTQNTI